MTSDPVLEFIDSVIAELCELVERLEARRAELKETNAPE